MNNKTVPQHYHEKLQELRHIYLQRLKKNLRDVRRLQELLRKDMAPVKDLQSLAYLAHNLIGSGATFGFPEISQSARELQNSLQKLMTSNLLLQDATRERQDVLKQITVFYDASRQAVQHDHPVLMETVKQGAQATEIKGAVIGILSRKENVVIDEIQYLTRQGYTVTHVDSLSGLKNIFGLSLAIISDELSVSDNKHLDDVMSRGQQIDLDVPFMFWLGQDDYKSYLKALRLGAQHSLAHTASGKELDEALQMLTQRAEQEPHIFIASTDDMLIDFYEHILHQQGFQSTVLKAHKDPLRVLAGRRRDVIIVDIVVPFSTGAEFITVLQQLPSFAEMQVIFTGTPEDYKSLAHPLKNVHILLKPFTPEQMINTLRSIFKY